MLEEPSNPSKSMDNTKRFTWMPIYRELAEKLAEWRARQEELISFLEQLRSQTLVVTPLNDRDEQGSRFLLKEIDPFTFFGVFNRGTSQDNRIAVLAEMQKYFDLQSPLPEDFNGIPVLNNQSSWFIAYSPNRKPEDVDRLWKVFSLALVDKPLEQPDFLAAFDDAMKVRYTNINLTMGLFWIRPDVFLNLDSTNRKYLKIQLPSGGLSAQFYRDTIHANRSSTRSFPELSYQAWIANEPSPPPTPDTDYWLVGAYWSDQDPQDQTQRFLEEGIWENGYDDRYLDEVRSMKVGDKIAIKSATTQRHGLPFDAYGNTVSRMLIKAIGTVVANRHDGRTVEVEWDRKFEAKTWYFFTNRTTVWLLRRDAEYNLKEYSIKLIDFIWYDKPQDYDWFIKRWWPDGGDPLPGDGPVPYSVADIVASGVFLSETELGRIIERLRTKKALILQGPPGVGKTFIARKLAYALMEEKDDQRLEMVQFHQSCSYEDFVRGYRPIPEQAGTFGLSDGVFLDICTQARSDPDRDYVFIIDEINRGNLSQIFGELLMLLEADKRGPEYAVPLVYRKEGEPHFFVPHNIYLVGLMNLADRSLAMVDYALRRRFAFINLKPQFDSPLFKDWLLARGMGTDLVNLIVDRMTALNSVIRDDPLLGENYQVGHSFFCPKGNNFAELARDWYDSIVTTEVGPLLKEYWYDNLNRAEQAQDRLLAP
jgi:5-methylcytosine-specific restriction enzyme B